MKQNPFENKSPESQKPRQEQLGIRVEISGPEDWKAYRDLRLEALNSEDEEMFGDVIKVRDRAKADLDWQNDLSPDNKNMLVVLSWCGNEAIGMGAAERKQGEEGAWKMTSAYVKPKFRGGGIGKKMFALRLEDIIGQGGKKVTLGIRAKNAPSLRLSEGFGAKMKQSLIQRFQKVSKIGFLTMEIDLTDSKVVQEIKDTLEDEG